MGATKSLATGVLVFGLLASATRASEITWQWTVWGTNQGGGVSQMTVGGDSPFGDSTASSAAPPAPAPAPPPPAPAPSPSSPPPADANSSQALGRGGATPPPPPVAPAPASAPSGSSSVPFDGYIDLGNGPYREASQLTTGGAQPWFNSPAVTQVFGGTPSAQQQSDFTNTVLQRVEQTFQQSGVPVRLTTDPNAPAAHQISVVSNTSYGPNSSDVGITTQGGDGFSFIDKFGSVQSVDQLEWIVAHNVAHEMMHAFGGDHQDTTGNYLDSAITPWNLMLDPNATFSPAEVQLLLSKNFQDNTARAYGFDAQAISDAPVPEPASIGLWSLAAAGAGLGLWRRRRAQARKVGPGVL